MNTIRFSHNWNKKLYQSVFTTIRKYDYKKLQYYEGAVDNTFKVILNEKDFCEAKLLEVQKIEALHAVDKGLICTDTGMDYKSALALFKKFGIDKDTPVIVLVFSNFYNYYDDEVEIDDPYGQQD